MGNCWFWREDCLGNRKGVAHGRRNKTKQQRQWGKSWSPTGSPVPDRWPHLQGARAAGWSQRLATPISGELAWPGGNHCPGNARQVSSSAPANGDCHSGVKANPLLPSRTILWHYFAPEFPVGPAPKLHPHLAFPSALLCFVYSLTDFSREHPLVKSDSVWYSINKT